MVFNQEVFYCHNPLNNFIVYQCYFFNFNLISNSYFSNYLIFNFSYQYAIINLYGRNYFYYLDNYSYFYFFTSILYFNPSSKCYFSFDEYNSLKFTTDDPSVMDNFITNSIINIYISLNYYLIYFIPFNTAFIHQLIITNYYYIS